LIEEDTLLASTVKVDAVKCPITEFNCVKNRKLKECTVCQKTNFASFSNALKGKRELPEPTF
jgi:hypothetical protein